MKKNVLPFIFIFVFINYLQATIFPTGEQAPTNRTNIFASQRSENSVQNYNLNAQIQLEENIIDELETRVLQVFNHNEWLSQISDDAVQMYYLWPGIDGLLTLYEATGKSEYVGYVVEYCKRYQSMGKDVNGDGYLDWRSSWYTEFGGYNHQHVEWRAGDGIARTVVLILTDTNLASYVEDGLNLKTFLEKHVWEKWTGGYSNVGNTTNVTHFIGRFGLLAISLYQATGDSIYLDYIIKKGFQLKKALHKNTQDAYIWGTYTNSSGIADVSHAGDAVNFMVEVHRFGLVFDDEDILLLLFNERDIRCLCNTVKKNLWNGSLFSPQFKNNVDGSGGYGRSGKNQGGWVKLAQFDRELQHIYYIWLNNLSYSSQIMVQLCGNLARASHLSSDTFFQSSIRANPKSGVFPLTVNFQGSATGGTSPYDYFWAFGDSHTSNLQNPTHTYNSPGAFAVVLTVTDDNSEEAISTVTITVTDPRKLLFVRDIKFTEVGQTQVLDGIQKDKWYDLYVYFNTPNGWLEIAYADIWFNSYSYQEGTIANRGGPYYANKNYVISFSIANDSIWARETEGTQEWSNITGKIGSYVKDYNNGHEFNSSEGWAKARIKLLRKAEKGIWSVNAYVKSKDGVNSALYRTEFECHDNDITSVEIFTQVPKQFNLQQNYPNPFNPSTEIGYSIPYTTDVHLAIFNPLGQHIVTLIQERQFPGQRKIRWDGRDKNGEEVSGGLYIYQLRAEKFTAYKKMILIR
jgi:PKD repeat protein